MIAASPAIAGRNSQVQQFIDADLAAIQAQIQDTQAEIQRLTGLPSRSADEEQQLQALQGRIVTLRQTYATMLGFSSSSGANLLTVVDPARVPPGPASPRVAAQHAPRRARRAAHRPRPRLPVRVPRRHRQVARRRGGGGRAADARHDHQDAGRQGAERDLPARHAPLSPGAGCRGVPEPAHEHRVRGGRRAGEDAPRHQLDPGRGQDDHRREPGRRLRPGRAAGRSCWTRTSASRASTGSSTCRTPTGSRACCARMPRGLDAVAQATEQENLRIITTGPLPPNPAELLGSQRMRTILARLAESSDLVVVDSPPLQAVTDAALLASITEGTLCDRRRTDPPGCLSGEAARRWPMPAPGSSAPHSTGCPSARAAGTTTTTTTGRTGPTERRRRSAARARRRPCRQGPR